MHISTDYVFLDSIPAHEIDQLQELGTSADVFFCTFVDVKITDVYHELHVKTRDAASSISNG